MKKSPGTYCIKFAYAMFDFSLETEPRAYGTPFVTKIKGSLQTAHDALRAAYDALRAVTTHRGGWNHLTLAK